MAIQPLTGACVSVLVTSVVFMFNRRRENTTSSRVSNIFCKLNFGTCRRSPPPKRRSKKALSDDGAVLHFFRI